MRHKIPYSDLTSLTDDERARYVDDMQPMEFGHTLEDQIGGQIDAGFVIAGFYEDVWPGTQLNEYHADLYRDTRGQAERQRVTGEQDAGFPYSATRAIITGI